MLRPQTSAALTSSQTPFTQNIKNKKGNKKETQRHRATKRLVLTKKSRGLRMHDKNKLNTDKYETNTTGPATHTHRHMRKGISTRTARV